MPEFWDRLQNSEIAGQHVVGKPLDASPGGAYFAASGAGGRVLVRLVRAGVPGAEAQLALWNRAAPLIHPNLVPILDTGRAEVDGVPLLYAVMEWPEEVLGAVLRERALTEEEARQALLAASDALSWLHAGGLAHGQVGPWSIVAAGDTVKLASDTVREAGESGAAEDVWALGLTACELLLRRVPEVGDDGPRLKPEERQAVAPFERFIRGCLRTAPAQRWTADRLAAHLRNPEPAPAAAMPVRRAVERQVGAPRVSAAAFPRWGYGAAAAVLAAGFFLLRPSHRNEASPPPTAAPQTPLARPAPVPPARAAGSGLEPAARTAKPESAARVWRVVAYTYAGLAAAEKKAQAINRKWPQFRAEVFSPRPDRGPYLVALGGRMTREEAFRLQRRALAQGLPRDTFARNYTR